MGSGRRLGTTSLRSSRRTMASGVVAGASDSTRRASATGARETGLKRQHVMRGTVRQVLVHDGERCVGWCQFGPPAEVATINNRKAYEKGLAELPDWRIGWQAGQACSGGSAGLGPLDASGAGATFSSQHTEHSRCGRPCRPCPCSHTKYAAPAASTRLSPPPKGRRGPLGMRGGILFTCPSVGRRDRG
jgi:hypothetical protein